MPRRKRGRPKKKLEVRKPLPSAYIFSLALGDKIYDGSGTTLLEALQATPVPIKIVSKGLIKVSAGKRKLEETWMPRRLKRLFQPLSQLVQAKQLMNLMR